MISLAIIITTLRKPNHVFFLHSARQQSEKNANASHHHVRRPEIVLCVSRSALDARERERVRETKADSFLITKSAGSFVRSLAPSAKICKLMQARKMCRVIALVTQRRFWRSGHHAFYIFELAQRDAHCALMILIKTRRGVK
jgi:hypothetical protein